MNEKLREELYNSLFHFWEQGEIKPTDIGDLIDLVITPIYQEQWELNKKLEETND